MHFDLPKPAVTPENGRMLGNPEGLGATMWLSTTWVVHLKDRRRDVHYSGIGKGPRPTDTTNLSHAGQNKVWLSPVERKFLGDYLILDSSEIGASSFRPGMCMQVTLYNTYCSTVYC